MIEKENTSLPFWILKSALKSLPCPLLLEVFSGNLLDPHWSHRIYPVWWNLPMQTCRRRRCSWRGNTADHWPGWRNTEIRLPVKRQTESTLHGTEKRRDLYIDRNITGKDIFIKRAHTGALRYEPAFLYILRKPSNLYNYVNKCVYMNIYIHICICIYK